jgi:uncharacterized protein (TIGR02271 family)
MAHTSTGKAVPANAAADDELVIPVVSEELEVETHRVARGSVRVRTRVEIHDQTVEIPFVHEEVVVEHVPVNTIVDGDPPQVTHEGDVLIIPVLEEVVVVETRLMLREFVRVSKRRTTTSAQETVALRRQVVDVERIEGPEVQTSSQRAVK